MTFPLDEATGIVSVFPLEHEVRKPREMMRIKMNFIQKSIGKYLYKTRSIFPDFFREKEFFSRKNKPYFLCVLLDLKPERIIPSIIFFIDLFGYFSMKFREFRPVETSLHMVCCMITQIPGDQIIYGRSDVV